MLVCFGASRNAIVPFLARASFPPTFHFYSSPDSATGSTAKMKFSAVLPAFMTLPLLVSAHFTLDYPTSRGFDEDIEPRASDGLTFPTSSASDLLMTLHV